MKETREADDPYLGGRIGTLLEETILPSPNSIDLLRSVRNDYVLRFDSRAQHIAELFQENTKLTPHSSLVMPETDEELTNAKKFYFSTTYRIDDADVTPGMEGRLGQRHAQLPPDLARLMSTCGPDGPIAPLLYGIDVVLFHGSRQLRVVPFTDRLWQERRIDDSDYRALRAAILRQPQDALAQARTFLCVVAVPWRHMMLLGPRGYRHMLLEAGNFLAQIQYVANQLKLAPRLCLDFYDNQVDRLLLIDGVERSTLAIIALQGGAE
jgi:hypothetical protein